MNDATAHTSANREPQSEFERYEAKYIVDKDLVPEIREFIQLFCIPDPNAGAGSPPEYVVNTLQLDSPTLSLHYAKERESINRFKLRCRTYWTTPTSPVFLEIKRKIQGVIVKSRTMIPRELWGHPFEDDRPNTIPFRSRRERLNYAEFGRLMDVLDARPILVIRYIRESYLGRFDRYSRVTFDRCLQYCPSRTWDLPPQDVRWRTMDSSVGLNRPFPGMILELKMDRDAPLWMLELTQRFNLVRIGFCKYSAAVRLESLYGGAEYSDTSENCSQSLMMA